MKYQGVYEFTEDKIGGAFGKYGGFIARHAWKVLFLSVIVNGFLGLGMVKLRSDIKAQQVYLPQGTRARKEQAIVENTFPDLSGSNFNSLRQVNLYGVFARVIIKAKQGQLMSRSLLEKVGDLGKEIRAITTESKSGSSVTFESVCARAHGFCTVEGDLFWRPDFLSAVDNGTVTYPVFKVKGFGPVAYSSLIGGQFELDPTGRFLQSAEYIHIKYSFRTDDEMYKGHVDSWVDAFKNRMVQFNSPYLDIAIGHYNSIDQEINKNVVGDIRLFAITILLMMSYAGIATLTSRLTNQVSQRVFLGLAGILSAGLAIISGFGFCAACGVDFVSIVGVVPFLVIGIGIDNMFILLSGLSGAQDKLTVEDKMADTMRSSGVGVTITTLTDLLAFLAGSFTNYIAVKNFCIYTGVAVLMCYINNVTLYAACVAINERRVAQNRHFLTCCQIKPKDELRKGQRSDCFVFCCGGKPPKSRDEAESLLDKIPRWLIPKLVLKLPFKIGIVMLFLVYLAGAVYGCLHLKQGLLFTQLLSEDSYYYKYSNLKEQKFLRQVPVSFVTTADYNYSDQRTQLMLGDLLSKAKENSYIEQDIEINWLNTYVQSPFFDNSSETNFISGLKRFFNVSAYRSFENDVVVNSAGTKITASRVHVMSRDLVDSQEEGALMLEIRDLADSAEIKSFAYSPLFILAEQYISILGQSLQSVGIALAAVFVITCIFMPHPVLILFVTVAVTMIMVGVFGYMYYVDVALSAITMIHLIMSVGFSIDFTAHICHGYMISKGHTSSLRVKQSVDKTGAPIFHGAVSSLVGIATLAMAKSYAFRTFATVMSFVLVFGIAHALLLLPVLLPWIGPGRLHEGENSTVVEGETENKQVEYQLERIQMNGSENKGADFDLDESNDRKIKETPNGCSSKGQESNEKTKF